MSGHRKQDEHEQHYHYRHPAVICKYRLHSITPRPSKTDLNHTYGVFPALQFPQSECTIGRLLLADCGTARVTLGDEGKLHQEGAFSWK